MFLKIIYSVQVNIEIMNLSLSLRCHFTNSSRWLLHSLHQAWIKSIYQLNIKFILEYHIQNSLAKFPSIFVLTTSEWRCCKRCHCLWLFRFQNLQYVILIVCYIITVNRAINHYFLPFHWIQISFKLTVWLKHKECTDWEYCKMKWVERTVNVW